MNFTSFSIPLNSGKSSIASSNDLHSSSGAYIDKWISFSDGNLSVIFAKIFKQTKFDFFIVDDENERKKRFPFYVRKRKVFISYNGYKTRSGDC